MLRTKPLGLGSTTATYNDVCTAAVDADFFACSLQRDLACGSLQSFWPYCWVQPTNATSRSSWHSEENISLEHIQGRAFQAQAPADMRVEARRARTRAAHPWLRRQCQIHLASAYGGSKGLAVCTVARTCSNVVLALPNRPHSSRKRRCHS